MVIVLSGAFLAAVPAAAGDTEYIKTERDDVRIISFKSFSGWTEFMFRGSNERADEFKIKETLFSPKLQLSTQGSMYHEKFLTFDLDALVSFEQRRTWGGDSRSDELSFNDYNASMLFFGERPANLRLFAKRNNAWIESPFRASYRVLGDVLGAELRVRRIPFPFGVAFDHMRREEEFFSEDRIEEQDQVSANLRCSGQNLNNDVTFRFADYTKNIQFQDYKTVNAGLNSTLHFKKRSPGYLRSSTRYFHQYGTLTRRDFSVFENVYYNITKHIENSIYYQFTEQGVRPSQNSADPMQLNRSHRGSFGFKHTLYGSLITGVQVYGSYEEFLNDTGADRLRTGEDKRRGLRADIDYRRRTAWGRLFAGVGYDLAHEEQSSTERSRQVLNEEYTLVDGNEPQLEHGNVDSTSIIVTDNTGFTVYIEGVDYNIIQFGNFTRLFRIPGGAITNGGIILVDYSYMFSPNLEFDIKGSSANIRFDSVKNVSLFYRYSRSNEDFLSGIPNGFLEDHKRHIAGVNYSSGGFSLGEEYEVNQYIADRFIANRLRADFNGAFSRSTRMHMGISYSLTRFADTGRELNVYMLTSRIITVIPGGMNLEGEGWLRFDRGRREDPTLDSDFAGLRVKIVKDLKALKLVMGGFYRKADDNLVKDERANFYLSLRRSF